MRALRSGRGLREMIAVVMAQHAQPAGILILLGFSADRGADGPETTSREISEHRFSQSNPAFWPIFDLKTTSGEGVENPRIGGSIPPQETKIKAKCDKHLAPQEARHRAGFFASADHALRVSPSLRAHAGRHMCGLAACWLTGGQQPIGRCRPLGGPQAAWAPPGRVAATSAAAAVAAGSSPPCRAPPDGC